MKKDQLHRAPLNLMTKYGLKKKMSWAKFQSSLTSDLSIHCMKSDILTTVKILLCDDSTEYPGNLIY